MPQDQGLSKEDTRHIYDELKKLKTLIQNDQNTIKSQKEEIDSLKQLERERLVQSALNTPVNFRQEVMRRLHAIKNEVQQFTSKSSTSTSNKETTTSRVDDEKELSPSSVHFYYFYGRGRGEVIRTVLAAMNIKWEETGMRTKEEFIKVKKSVNSTYDQVPVLQIDGLTLTQSGSILRYLGNKYNLYPQYNDLKNIARVEEVMAASDDFKGPLRGYVFHQDSDRSRKETKFDRYLPVWERYLKQNNDWRFVPNQLTLADLSVFEALDCYVEVFGKLDDDTFGKYPMLQQLYNQVKKLGRIQEWMEERKKYFSPPDQYRKEINDCCDLNL